MFGMLIDQDPNERSFNNVSFGKGNTSRSLERLESERNKLIRQNNPKTIPDFLKARNANGEIVEKKSNTLDRQMPNMNNSNRQMPNRQMPNMNNSNKQMKDTNNSLEQFSGIDEMGSNFSSINSVGEMYKPKEIVDDNSSFADRLKKLQGERNNLEVPTSEQKKIENNNQSGSLVYNPNIELNNNLGNNTISDSEEANNNLVYDPNEESFHDQVSNEVNFSSENNNYSTNINEINNTDDNTLLEKISNLENEKMDLLNTCRELGVIVDKYKELQDSYNSLKKETVDKNEFNDKMKTIKEQRELISYNKSILNQRENELDSKEEEIRQLLAYYYLINQKKYIQVDISSKNKLGKYTYNFNNISNIQSIKLMSYSLPKPRFNINDHNNLLKYMINDKEEEIKIDNGNYTINNLIKSINKKCDFKLHLNTDQKLEIKSKNKIKLINTLLSTQVLGFINNVEGKKIKASNTWDLRKPDKLFLYIENIQKDVPIGILYFSDIFPCEILLDETINLDKLDIKMTDENGNIYNFSNLNHSLSFKFEVKIDIEKENVNLSTL